VIRFDKDPERFSGSLFALKRIFRREQEFFRERGKIFVPSKEKGKTDQENFILLTNAPTRF
jgi:hypothetical protein